MAISVQTNIAQALPQTPAQAEVPALRSGQVVEVRVAGAGANGVTQLDIGNQLVDAALAVRLPPGTLIHLLVQGTGPNLRLTVLLQTAPTPTPAPTPAQGQTPSSNGPAAAQQSAVLPQSSPQALPVQTQAPQPNVTSTANATTPAPPPQAPAQTGAVNARPVLIPAPVPAGVRVQGATAPPQTGQATPQAPVAALPQPVVSPQIEPGAVLRFQLQGSGANARPVLVPVTTPGAEASKSQGQTQPRQNVLAPSPNPVRQALVQTVQQSVARQDSIATLLTSLAGLGAKLADLPKPVAQAGAQLLAARLNLNGRPLDGASLKAALTRSGVLFESNLQKGGVQALPQGDLKAALLNLRSVLGTWFGKDAPGKALSQQNTSPPPPPTQRTPPRADRPVSLPLSPAAPNADTAAKLLGQSEAALARMRLVQISSLPETALRTAPGSARLAPEINIELPLLFGGEVSVGQFQIFRDGGGGGADESFEGEWKMRFSINFSRTGEVGATVSLRGGKTGVMLWAEREETAAVLQERQGELADALSARGLEPGVIRCRTGHPPQAQKPVGAFMDNCS